MIKKYKVKCECGFKENLEYGKHGKDEIMEVFSCKKCKNMFSILATKSKKCPKCKSEELIAYNPNKAVNISFYQDMLDKNFLDKTKYEDLMKYWESIEEKKCPKCKKEKLSWK